MSAPGAYHQHFTWHYTSCTYRKFAREYSNIADRLATQGKMKAFSLHGPLAHYQRQVCELQGTIEQLQSSGIKLQQELVQKEQELVGERNLSRQLQHSRVPDLQNQIAALSHTVQELQAQARISCKLFHHHAV
jgi:hypothetical protein